MIAGLVIAAVIMIMIIIMTTIIFLSSKSISLLNYSNTPPQGFTAAVVSFRQTFRNNIIIRKTTAIFFEQTFEYYSH